MIMLVEVIRQALQVNTLIVSLCKKGYEFPMSVGAFNYDLRLHAKNLLKSFEKKHQLETYEVLRLMFDPNIYAKDVLQIGSVIKNITTLKDYWVDCKDELESWDHTFSRLTVDQIKM